MDENKAVEASLDNKAWLIMSTIVWGSFFAFLITVFPDDVRFRWSLKSLIELVFTMQFFYIAIGCALANILVAALVVKFCMFLKSWAYCGKSTDWSLGDKLGAGTFWPITLLFCLIFYIFMGIINRTF